MSNEIVPETSIAGTITELPEGWELPGSEEHSYNYQTPTGDLYEAIKQGRFLNADNLTVADEFTIHDIKRVDRWYVDYHGTEWTPEDSYCGSELTMVILGELHDGRWFTINAWNDYTGWGCQDDSQIRITATRERAIAKGLDKEGRERLGLTLNELPVGDDK